MFSMTSNIPAARRLLVLALVAMPIVACSEASDTTLPAAPQVSAEVHVHQADALTPAQLEGIARVRSATARFVNIKAAKLAGYDNQFPAGCKETSAGAQGYHFLNNSLADANIELLKPELVMYEPLKNGELQLIGVDYIVPYTAWTKEEAPTLLGVPFMRNDPLGVWALHIWTKRPNPAGMFAMWNPAASCRYATF